jgi:hypothetical protein
MNNPYLANAATWQNNEIYAASVSGALPHTTAWRKVVLWTVGAYIVLNSGFMLVRIPPVGAGLPIGEFVLLISLLIINTRALLPKMASEVWLLPILLWWAMSLSRCLMDTTVGGVWSFRDASQAIESLFLIVGFWLVNSEENLRYFFSWFRKLLLVLTLYSLLSPFDIYLRSFSPQVPGVSSGGAPLLFSMTNTSAMLLWCACWLLIDRKRNSGTALLKGVLACLMVAYSVAFSQSREMYLSVIAVGFVLLIFKIKMATKWLSILLVGAILIGAVSISGLDWRGRLGDKISLDFILLHFQTISGAAESGTGGEEGIAGAAQGAELRMGWWRHIYSQMSESPEKMIFGLGYGMPLTDFHAPGGVMVREPHNSVISVVARLGIAGLLVWVMMQAAFCFSWWRSYQLCKRMGWLEAQNYLLLFLIYGVLIVTGAIGEDVFEKPFNAISYYFFLGVVLRYGRYLRQTAAGQETV